jgi:iron complex outermembrane receptor protein
MRRVAVPAFVTLSTLASAVPAQTPVDDGFFDLGRIVVTGERPDGLSSVGGSVVTQEQIWTHQKLSLEQALDFAPGVTTTIRGRRNEYDIFVRGFDRLQVPLSIDGVRAYLPADNRIDFARFMTADIAEVQIQKGYASVLDGSGAMGGAINLVTGKPTDVLELEGGVSMQGRDADLQDRSGFFVGGSRQERFYVQGSLSFTDRDFWTMSSDYEPVPNSLEDGGERQSSYTEDWRVNLKVGYTPNETDEYAININKQGGEKGSPINVYNNPPVPNGSYWTWPYWDIMNTTVLTSTQFDSFALQTRTFYNTFENGLQSYDNLTYTTQSQPFAFFSPYDDRAYGVRIDFNVTSLESNTLKMALHYRTDEHIEQQTSRPTHPTLAFEEPPQEQVQNVWSVGIENTFHLRPELDIVAGVSYDDYEVTKAQEFGNHDNNAATPNILFERPKGGGDAFNSQVAAIYRYNESAQLHFSISDRGRFPTFFELYSTRFGTATPNPDLGPERATNYEIGWERSSSRGDRLGATLFYSDVSDLIQTAVLPDSTTQAQNVGNGRFRGIEVYFDKQVARGLTVGGNYTYIDREIHDALQPNLQADGVADNEVVLYATWRPVPNFAFTPSLEAADDRWSNVNTNPQPANPYVRTGAYHVYGLDATYSFANDVELGIGARNVTDDHYELSWGFPQAGRSVYVKASMSFE